MAATSASEKHLRFDRTDLDLLGRALVISLAIHLLAFGVYETNRRFHWLQKIPVPAWFKKAQQILVVVPPAKMTPPPTATEPPLMFVEVNPSQSVTEAPKNNMYYSDKSSKAANVEADKETDTPKITGTQTHVAKTEAVLRSQQFPLRPATAPAPTQPQPQTETQADAKSSQTPGDLAFAKPQAELRQNDGRQENAQPKPRTIAEAMARQRPNSIAGEKMKQDGGVKHRAVQAAFDVTATPFGAYDAAIIAAIQSRWYSLIDSQRLTRATGKMVLQFRLNYDGRVTDMTVLENNVGELLGALCQRAVEDPAPFAPWPDDMRRMVGANFREVKFTFFYD